MEEESTLAFGIKIPTELALEFEGHEELEGAGLSINNYRCSERNTFLLVKESVKDVCYGNGGVSFVGKEIRTKNWMKKVRQELEKIGLENASGRIGWWLVASSS